MTSHDTVVHENGAPNDTVGVEGKGVAAHDTLGQRGQEYRGEEGPRAADIARTPSWKGFRLSDGESSIFVHGLHHAEVLHHLWKWTLLNNPPPFL